MLYIAPGISPTAMNSTVQYQWEPIGVVTHQKQDSESSYLRNDILLRREGKSSPLIPPTTASSSVGYKLDALEEWATWRFSLPPLQNLTLTPFWGLVTATRGQPSIQSHHRLHRILMSIRQRTTGPRKQNSKLASVAGDHSKLSKVTSCSLFSVGNQAIHF